MAFKLFGTREEAVTCNADAATAAYGRAAEATKRGDHKAAKEHLAWAKECDQVANDFADGRNDDLVADR